MEVLSNLLIKANDAYYNESKPFMSDADYDTLFSELKDLEGKHPGVSLSASATTQVGAPTPNSDSKVVHAIPMLSINSIFSVDELRRFFSTLSRGHAAALPHLQHLMRAFAPPSPSPAQRTAALAPEELILLAALSQLPGSPLPQLLQAAPARPSLAPARCVLEHKYDGLAMSLLYRAHGHEFSLDRCATRGDKHTGEDVTERVRQCVAVRPRLPRDELQARVAQELARAATAALERMGVPVESLDAVAALADALVSLGWPSEAAAEVRGEVFMTDEEFTNLNALAPAGKTYSSARNLASGLLHRDDAFAAAMRFAPYALRLRGDRWLAGDEGDDPEAAAGTALGALAAGGLAGADSPARLRLAETVLALTLSHSARLRLAAHITGALPAADPTAAAFVPALSSETFPVPAAPAAPEVDLLAADAAALRGHPFAEPLTMLAQRYVAIPVS
jgi:hypothetical protein